MTDLIDQQNGSRKQAGCGQGNFHQPQIGVEFRPQVRGDTEQKVISLPADIGFARLTMPGNPQAFQMVPEAGVIPMAMVRRAHELSQQGMPNKRIAPAVRREIKQATARAFKNTEYFEWLKNRASGQYEIKCVIASDGVVKTGPVVEVEIKDRRLTMQFIVSFAG